MWREGRLTKDSRIFGNNMTVSSLSFLFCLMYPGLRAEEPETQHGAPRQRLLLVKRPEKKKGSLAQQKKKVRQ